MELAGLLGHSPHNVSHHILMKFHTLALRAKSIFIYSLIDVPKKFIITASIKTEAQWVNKALFKRSNISPNIKVGQILGEMLDRLNRA